MIVNNYIVFTNFEEQATIRLEGLDPKRIAITKQRKKACNELSLCTLKSEAVKYEFIGVKNSEDFIEVITKSGGSFIAVFEEGTSYLLSYGDDRTYFFDEEDEKKRILNGGIYR